MKKTVFFLVVFLLASTSLQAVETKILQNGLDGYEGCEDTYLTQEGKTGDKNHGSDPTFRLRGGS